MTTKQAKVIGITAAITGSKHARTVQALMEMRKLLNDICCGNGLGIENAAIIRQRLECIHDGLAKEFGMGTWGELWAGEEFPTFT